MNRRKINIIIALLVVTVFVMQLCIGSITVLATENTNNSSEVNKYESHKLGGGYAVSEQIPGVGYTTEVYDASNGLPTSDAMCLYGTRDGRMWIGGYSGVIVYDGNNFDRLDTSDGLTSARAIFEDSKGRVWIGTNDNGVVVIDGDDKTHITYKDGLPSSSIRMFAEDKSGNVFIGTTAGICYADTGLSIHNMSHDLIDKTRIIKIESDESGKIYGVTAKGVLFSVENCKIKDAFESSALGLPKAMTILVDKKNSGNIYIGDEHGDLYYGPYGSDVNSLSRISVLTPDALQWLCYACDRVWFTSASRAGYLDENNQPKMINNIPINEGIEMVTSDYQGNIWFASSAQGAMKIVTNNFVDINQKYGLKQGVVNATCLLNDALYIGMNEGMLILDNNGQAVDNNLTRYIGDTRIRCIKADSLGNLWVATYTDDKGLLVVSPTGEVTSYTKENGMPDNEIRCITFADDGSALIGTNGGLVVIKDGQIVRIVGAAEGVKNTVFLTVEDGGNGVVYAGSDGDGIYKITGSNVERISRDEGLSSDVILRIIRDEKRGVFWIVTSNSIEYLKNGNIKQVTTFPYNNNYDMYFDSNDNAWILSSYGLYMVSADDMINDEIKDYRLYTIDSGLPYAITSNSYSAMDNVGNLYMPGRNGAIKVNINNFYEQNEKILLGINSILCDDERITPDADGKYTIPSSRGRIQITPSVMDYTMLDPTVHVYLEGGPDNGITTSRSKISTLEYTDLPYGSYKLHIEVLDKKSGKVLQDESFDINKKARFGELIIVRVLVVLALIVAAGVIVWRVITSTTIRRQYDEIRKAKDDAEQANSAKTRFLANMSHEIRTPINTIMGMNEMTLREDATGVPKGYFMSIINNGLDIRNASESLLSLVNDLLDMSKIESGKMHLVEQEYDVTSELRSMVSMIRQRSMQKELLFDVVIDEILPKRLYGDAAKIKQIVLNLLTNAVKYTDVGGILFSVTMTERKDNNASIRVSVKDTGMGIKEEEMEKLFEAYERLDEEKNSSVQGTGLGLDISRRLAEMMGGELRCESVYGEGSEFIFTYSQRIVDDTPLGVFKEHDTASKGPYVPQFIAPDADVLVVDDNPMNLNVIKGLLKSTKVFVNTALSGEEALDKIKDSHFDIVLLDHMMPGMDGIETLQRIRRMSEDLPVYALTANSTAGEEFYVSKGFNGYLSKPVQSEVLERTIMKHLSPEKMIKPTKEDEVKELTEIPDDMKWIYDVEGISVDDGINNSGGVNNYIFSLGLFLDTISDNSKAIRDAYDKGNIRLLTIKVHSLKSSARIIGAMDLSSIAEKLENAGNNKDMNVINNNIGTLLLFYEEFEDKLSRLNNTKASGEEKEEITEAELKKAYEALSDAISKMDYDSVEKIVEELENYRLSDSDYKKVSELRKCLKAFDFDKMEELFS